MKLLIYLLTVPYLLFSQQQKRYNGYIQADFLGTERPLYHNNNYSKDFTKNDNYVNLKFIWFTNKQKSMGLGFSINNYVHSINYHEYRNDYRVFLKKEVELKGVDVFGDIWLHLWSEFRIGPAFHYSIPLKEKHLFSTVISSGFAFSSRGKPLVSYDDDKFVYPKSKLGYGSYIDSELNYFYTLSKGHPNVRIGIGLEMVYGNVQTEYEIRYGVSDNYNKGIYDSYNYKHNYIILRYGFAFKIRADLGMFDMKDKRNSLVKQNQKTIK